MIQHVYERAISCDELDEVYVATDDQRILTCVHGFGGKAVMTSTAHCCGTDRICEAAEKRGVHSADIVINIQGDQPKFHPSHIGQLVGPLLEDMAIPMTTLKWRFEDVSDIQSPKDVLVVTDSNGFAIYFSRARIPFFRDERSNTVYYKHLGLYGFRMDFLTQFARLPQGELESAEKLEQLRALEHGFRIKVIETRFDSPEVDYQEDIKKVEELLQ